jgi:hypothetical protein
LSRSNATPRETLFVAGNLQAMPSSNDKKPIPPQDVIREDSGPTITDTKTPPPADKRPKGEKIDVDDAMIEEPKDDVFKK